MVKAIRIEEFGGPEVLRWRDVEPGEPGPGQVRLRHTAVGLNFIDTYHRSGLYPLELPSGLGSEAAGVVEALGAGVEGFEVGQRVAYTGRPPDAYSEARLIAVQWAKHLGATVIGTVSTDAKAELARAHGCDHIVMADSNDLAGEVRRLNGGEGVAAVYDSVGRDTFYASLDSLRPHGVMVSFGNASGPVEPFAPLELAKRGSLYVTRPVLFDFISTRDALLGAAAELFDVIRSGAVKIEVNQRYPLADAAEAHRDLEARRTTGSTVLVP